MDRHHSAIAIVIVLKPMQKDVQENLLRRGMPVLELTSRNQHKDM